MTDAQLLSCLQTIDQSLVSISNTFKGTGAALDGANTILAAVQKGQRIDPQTIRLAREALTTSPLEEAVRAVGDLRTGLAGFIADLQSELHT